MPPASIAAPAARAPRGEFSYVVRASLGVLRGYKVLVSPLFSGACRYSPSCSDYMAEAMREHGFVRGLRLGVMRLLRCHPFGGHGFDPVPPRRG